jgi:hypothetical protein
MPQGAGIIDRLKRAPKAEREHIVKEGMAYNMASPRTKRRIRALS